MRDALKGVVKVVKDLNRSRTLNLALLLVVLGWTLWSSLDMWRRAGGPLVAPPGGILKAHVDFVSSLSLRGPGAIMKLTTLLVALVLVATIVYKVYAAIRNRRRRSKV